MMSKQKIVFLSALGLIVLLFINSFIKEKKTSTTLIKRCLVEKRDIVECVLGSGKVYSQQEKIIFAKIDGDIKSILVTEGQTVKKGDLLLTIDNKQIEQQLKLAEAKTQDIKEQLKEINDFPSKTRILQAQNTLDKATANADRLSKKLNDEEELLAKGFISKVKYQETQNAYKIAQNDLEVAKANLNKVNEKPKEHEITLIESNLMQAENEYATLKEKYDSQQIKAPFAGTILDLNIPKSATKIAPNEKLITLADMEQLVVRGSVFESDINKLKKGQQVHITIDNTTRLTGTLHFISQKAKSSGNINTFEIEIYLNESSKNLRYAMNVNFQIVIQKKENVLAIPLEYLKFDANQTFVYKAHKNKLIKTPIVRGIDDKRYAEIISGLKKGDMIALEL